MGLRDRYAELSSPLKLAVFVVATVAGIAIVGTVVVGVAVVGSFAMGSGEEVQQGGAPDAAFGSTATESGLTISHEAGDSIHAAKLLVVVGDTEKTWAARANGDGEVSVGDTLDVDAPGGTTVKLVFDGSSGRTTLAAFDA